MTFVEIMNKRPITMLQSDGFLIKLKGVSRAFVPSKLFESEMSIDNEVFDRINDVWVLIQRCLIHKPQSRPPIWEVESTLEAIIDYPTAAVSNDIDYFTKSCTVHNKDSLNVRETVCLSPIQSVLSEDFYTEEKLSISYNA